MCVGLVTCCSIAMGSTIVVLLPCLCEGNVAYRRASGDSCAGLFARGEVREVQEVWAGLTVGAVGDGLPCASHGPSSCRPVR
jgi:hypothetical protein